MWKPSKQSLHVSVMREISNSWKHIPLGEEETDWPPKQETKKELITEYLLYIDFG